MIHVIIRIHIVYHLFAFQHYGGIAKLFTVVQEDVDEHL